MELIKRDYLQKLVNVIGTPDIKVITGVRRSGKSKLLEALKKYIEIKFKNHNIIHINFNLPKFENLKEYHKLYDYIDKNYKENMNNFVLIDEIQLCNGFENTINGIHAEERFDIYITGSNAFLLSSDLATLFTGRTYEIQIFPFSFKEYLDYFNFKDIYASFDKYVLDGGMSGSYFYKKEEEKYNYLTNVYDTLIIRDIIDRYGIKSQILIEKLSNFLMDNISNLTSSNKIANELNSKGDKTNNKTIDLYLSYLCNSFLYYKVKRYDIRGKQYLATQDKYYLVDTSFRYAKLGTKNNDLGRVYENIVAIELIRRGYEIYVGTLYNKEIDFVAIKRNEKIYIQVSSDITSESTFKREVAPLLSIKDAYPKILIARTKQSLYQYEGIQIYDISDWLML